MSDDNGDVIPSVNGYVLTSDSQGNASWVDPATIGAGASSLDPGTSDGQTLRWNATAAKWQPTNAIKVLGGGTGVFIADPATTAYQIGGVGSNMVTVNAAANANSTITLNSPHVKLPLGNTAAANRVLVATDAQGNVAWANPATIGGGGGGNGQLPAGELGDTLWYDGTSWLNTNKLQWDGSGNSLKFNGNDLYLTGNGDSLNAGMGRFLFAKDANGKASWNKTLIYEDVPVGNNTLTLNTVHVQDPDSDSTTVPVFLNDGLTVLNGSTTANDKVTVNADLKVSADGDLYLFSVDNPTAQELNTIKPLCYNSSTHKVTKCTGLSEAQGGHLGSDNNNNTTLTFYPVDNGETYTFDFSGTVGLKWCAGGGGGGGGGIGGPNGNILIGGGGGGGGGMGQCATSSLSVDPGDILSWEIGSGGIGGSGATYTNVFILDGASSQDTFTSQVDGSSGGSTSVYFNGNQQGQTQLAGAGGKFGQSVSSALCSANNGQAFPCGGINGNLALGLGTPQQTDYYNGRGGQFGGNGGRGGYGETSAGMNVGTGPGRPGGNGQLGPSETTIMQGGHGSVGPYGEGGGGGGGSAAIPQIIPYTTSSGLFGWGEDIWRIDHTLKGGNGGRGGDGYVTITGLPDVPPTPTTEIVYDTAGTFTLLPQTLPGGAQNLTIEVWGAGGGGGNLLGGSNYSNVCGGGGGSGSYGKLENFPRPTTGVSIVVGAGGVVNTTGTGGTGGQTKFGTLLVAPGGVGGQGTAPGSCGNGGAGAGPATGATQHVDGNDGQDGAPGSQADTDGGGAGGVGHQGYGNGGKGVTDAYGGNTLNATTGSSGRVRITWD
jgi:hypothetical protein